MIPLFQEYDANDIFNVDEAALHNKHLTSNSTVSNQKAMKG